MARAARLLSKEGGREEREGDEKYFKELAKKVKRAFQALYMGKNNTGTSNNSGGAIVGDNSQTALSCALYYGLAPSDQIPALLERLVAVIRQNHYHLDVGNIGCKCLLNVGYVPFDCQYPPYEYRYLLLIALIALIRCCFCYLYTP